MTSRRQFLQIGITATAWPLMASAAHASWACRETATPLLGVVYDTRFAESVAFARRSAALGLRTHAIAGDMTRLWYDEVYHHWRQCPTALAGLTAHGPLFCFAELARDVGMRVVFRAEHRATTDGAIAHAFTGPVSLLSEALDACGMPERIWTAMADVVAQCPRGRTEIASATRVSGMAAPGRDSLYTWVIAPVVKA
ncbi:MAG TPA: hypothetical protein VFS23_18085 [Vicinamibacterales bacterium]|nr:hypothetical protein [Vicinamibacterales bacterium]